MLFERDVPFRPDWEAVLTPVVDALVARPDVDADALTAYGISQAGYWLPRALAFEHRFVAAVRRPRRRRRLDVVDRPPPQAMIELLDNGRSSVRRHMAQVDQDPEPWPATFAFRARPYGITDSFDLYTAVRTYQLRDVAGQDQHPAADHRPGGRAVLARPVRRSSPDMLAAPHDVVHVHPARRGELPLPAAGPTADGLPDLRLADRRGRPPGPARPVPPAARPP